MGGFNVAKEKEAGNIEDEGTFVHIHNLDDIPMTYKDKDGMDQSVGIVIAGAHSKRFREIEGKHRKRRIKQRDLTGHKLHADSTEKVVHCTLSWVGFTYNDDKGKEQDLEFTQHNVRELYNWCPWVLDQVVEVMNDHQLFSESKSTS